MTKKSNDMRRNERSFDFLKHLTFSDSNIQSLQNIKQELVSGTYKINSLNIASKLIEDHQLNLLEEPEIA